jgi:hypothetical protein
MGCSFITLREPCNNQQPRCDINATFSNISTISWRPVLVVEEAGVSGKNHTRKRTKTNKIKKKQRQKKTQLKKLNKRATVILPHIKPDVSSSTREEYAVLVFYKTRRVTHVFKSGKSSVGDSGRKPIYCKKLVQVIFISRISELSD